MFDIFLIVSALLFVVGIVIIITRRNVIMVLIGIELIFNAGNLNLVAFSKYDSTLQGQMLALFVIVIAACEAAVALAIIIQAIKLLKNSNLDDMNQLKG